MSGLISKNLSDDKQVPLELMAVGDCRQTKTSKSQGAHPLKLHLDEGRSTSKSKKLNKVHTKNVSFEHVIDYDGISLIEHVDLTTQTKVKTKEIVRHITTKTRSIGAKKVRETTVEYPDGASDYELQTILDEKELELFNVSWGMLWKPSIATEQIDNEALNKLRSGIDGSEAQVPYRIKTKRNTQA